MIKLTIDNQPVHVNEDTTLLAAARQLDIHIPTLCHAADFKPSTSCMVCVVKIEGFKTFVPACGTRVAENMIVHTDTPEIQKARKTAVELLLSDHIGDCDAPCEIGCPANMDIPQMIHHIAIGDFEASIAIVKAAIPLPAVCGRICPGPCEKVCRRKQADAAVSICLLKRFVADIDLAKQNPYTPECEPSIDKKVAIVGAGPAGLSAAYYLRQSGIAVTLYDDHEKPGGAIRYAEMDRALLPVNVVDTEIEQIFKLGIEFVGNIRLGRDVSIQELRSHYDSALIAVGTDGVSSLDPDIEIKDGKIKVVRQQYMTSVENVFAAGGCIGSRNLCIRAIADGKQAAMTIKSRLLNSLPTLQAYNHRMAPPDDTVLSIFLKHASSEKRTEPQRLQDGFTPQQAQTEAVRCLRCDCRKAGCCALRDRATEFAARQKAWQGQTKLFERIEDNDSVIYEPTKCIKCGLCVQFSSQKNTQGLTFAGRGFDMEVTMPLHNVLEKMDKKVLAECVNICPTGALAFDSKD